MPYCKKCGNELKRDGKFCQSCGVSGDEGRIESNARSLNKGRIIFFVIGGVILLISCGLLFGGGTLYWLNTSITDSEGFITSEGKQLETDFHAIVFQHMDVDVSEVVGPWGVWRPSPGDFVTIKITVSSNDPAKNISIGIASSSDATSYLNDVNYDEITRFSVSSLRTIDVEYAAHSGNTVPSAPNLQTFWITKEQGVGTQILEWSPELGNYWIILMNEDGSVGVDSTIRFGVNIPLLSTIGMMLLVGGIVALVIGMIIIYFGIRR